MSAQTVSTAAPLDLPGYLAAVRRELGDLGQDEVDELTGGLEADLADALAGSGAAPEEVFGPPGEYAVELRTAAGLPARPVASSRRRRWRRADLQSWLESKAWWPSVREFLIASRPVWWAFRGLVVYQVLAQIFTDAQQLAPTSGGGLILLLLLVVLSIEVGRRDWAGDNRLRRNLVGAVDLLAAGSLLIAAWSVLIQSHTQLGPLPVRSTDTVSFSAASASSPDMSGLSNSGTPVVNIFPYDSAGNLLQGVQLYDQEGNRIEPAELGYPDENENWVDLVPALGADGQPRYNVYPLRERPADSFDSAGEPVPAQVRDARAPSRSQYPVAVSPLGALQGSPAATPKATPEATAEATSGATPEATAEVTSGATPGTAAEATAGATSEATVEATSGATPAPTPKEAK